MTVVVSPIHPGELPKDIRKGVERIVERVAAQSAVKGGGADLLLRIYMAGVYHGLELGHQPKEQP